MEHEILTVKEVAHYLRTHPSTIYRMLRRRAIPAFRVGRDWKFAIEAIDKWRRSLEVETASVAETDAVVTR